jgi:F-type H+-transporting ATPase subunit gamma
VASLLEIRNKIKATKSTKKITKAMQLVAASKMKTFQRSSLAVKAYTEALEKSLALCGATLAETDFGKPRAEERRSLCS